MAFSQLRRGAIQENPPGEQNSHSGKFWQRDNLTGGNLYAKTDFVASELMLVRALCQQFLISFRHNSEALPLSLVKAK
jgi:hypothetical protein